MKQWQRGLLKPTEGSSSSPWRQATQRRLDSRRYGGREWTHVVAAGRELYAWTGASRAVWRAAIALVHPTASAPVSFDDPSAARFPTAFAIINRCSRSSPFELVVAVLWFFKAAAWRGVRAPNPRHPGSCSTADRLLALNQRDRPCRSRPTRLHHAGSDLELGRKRWIDAPRSGRPGVFTTLLRPDRRTVDAEYQPLGRRPARGASARWKAARLTFSPRDTNAAEWNSIPLVAPPVTRPSVR
jgi:hypothetical protein